VQKLSDPTERDGEFPSQKSPTGHGRRFGLNGIAKAKKTNTPRKEFLPKKRRRGKGIKSTVNLGIHRGGGGGGEKEARERLKIRTPQEEGRAAGKSMQSGNMGWRQQGEETDAEL